MHARTLRFHLYNVSARVLAMGLVLVLAVLACIMSQMWRELDYMQQRDRQQLELLAGAAELHASQLLDASELALDNLAASLRNDHKALSQLPTQQAHYLQSLPFLHSLALINPQGQVLLSTHPPDQGRYLDLRQLTITPLSSEDMVIGLRQTELDLTRISADRTMLVRRGFIPLLRKVQLTSSSYVVLVAQFSLDALTSYQQHLLNIGRPGTKFMLKLNNGSVIGQLEDDEYTSVFMTIDQSTPPENQVSSGPSQTWELRSLSAWRRSSKQPFISIAQLPRSVILQQWQTKMRGPLAITGLALAFIVGITYSTWRTARASEIAQYERNKAMQESVRREQELSLLFNSVQELIFRTDSQGSIRLANARWHAFTHQPAEQARGRRLRDVVHLDSRTDVDALFDARSDNGIRTTQAQLPGLDGVIRTLEISVAPLRNQAGKLRGFVGSAMDVTALLFIQQSLRENQALTNQLLEANPLPISLTDKDGNLRSVNQAWESFMCVPRQQVLGKRCQDLVPQREAVALADWGGPICYRQRLPRPGGHWREVQITKVRLSNHLNEPAGVLSVMLDITDFLEARSLSEQAARAKDEFVANISHELRTPLQSILGFSELGMARRRQNDEHSNMFSDIHAAGNRMLSLVNNLLDLSKIESTVGAFEFNRHDVRDLIEDVTTELQPQTERKNLRLDLQLGRIPLVAKVDPSRFCQVVRNVLANAVKFSPENSLIRMSAEVLNEVSIELTVRDQGPGIPEAELEQIFLAFVQSSQTRDGAGGTGLGLAICQKIISAHGGHIQASNASDGGAVFRITLPTADYTDTMPGNFS